VQRALGCRCGGAAVADIRTGAGARRTAAGQERHHVRALQPGAPRPQAGRAPYSCPLLHISAQPESLCGVSSLKPHRSSPQRAQDAHDDPHDDDVQTIKLKGGLVCGPTSRHCSWFGRGHRGPLRSSSPTVGSHNIRMRPPRHNMTFKSTNDLSKRFVFVDVVRASLAFVYLPRPYPPATTSPRAARLHCAAPWWGTRLKRPGRNHSLSALETNMCDVPLSNFTFKPVVSARLSRLM